VTVILQEAQIGGVVEPLGLSGTVAARTEPIVQVVPDVGAGEIHDSPATAVVIADREVAWVGARDHEWSRSSVLIAE